ncbi:hypothetical protein MKZ17_10890 [Solibacillus sp. FSL R7-0682]|uniref:hypothetical protein n=1 Tax=Solibacillus sp. FSL R7-0682 TaxID=2921690 RepID=UPI0030F5879D
MSKLLQLIEVRKIVTILFAIVFAYMSITGMLDVQNVIVILTMVFAYYFNKGDNTEQNKK